MYTLILTLIIQWQDTKASLLSVPNFTSLEHCTTAGNAWLVRESRGMSHVSNGDYDISALCVKQ
jgi:hypothetical protein